MLKKHKQICPSLLFALKAKTQGDILRQNMSCLVSFCSSCCSEAAPYITTCPVSQNLTCETDGTEERSGTKETATFGLVDHSAEHSLSLMHIWMKRHQRSVRWDVAGRRGRPDISGSLAVLSESLLLPHGDKRMRHNQNASFFWGGAGGSNEGLEESTANFRVVHNIIVLH